MSFCQRHALMGCLLCSIAVMLAFAAFELAFFVCDENNDILGMDIHCYDAQGRRSPRCFVAWLLLCLALGSGVIAHDEWQYTKQKAA
jgi:hypothetical protein